MKRQQTAKSEVKPIEGELTLKELKLVVGGNGYSPANKRRRFVNAT